MFRGFLPIKRQFSTTQKNNSRYRDVVPLVKSFFVFECFVFDTTVADQMDNTNALFDMLYMICNPHFNFRMKIK